MRFARRPFFHQAIFYSDALNLLYLNNPKVACSTIKKSIWSKTNQINGVDSNETNMGALYKSPIRPSMPLSDELCLKIAFAKKMTVVRNPYSRALSAYLDKIHGDNRDPGVWPVFAKQHGLAVEDQITFLDFLRLLKNSDVQLLDPHFAPQTLTTLVPFVKFDLVGRLENMEKFESDFRTLGVEISDFKPHRTNALEKLEQYYGDEEQAIVQKVYAHDFVNFNYDIDIEQNAPISDYKNVCDDASVFYNFTLIMNDNLDRIRQPVLKAEQEYALRFQDEDNLVAKS